MKDENDRLADNMHIWNYASNSPAGIVKNFNVKGNNTSSPTAYWFFQKATELFGPIGFGWGIKEGTLESKELSYMVPEQTKPASTYDGKTTPAKFTPAYNNITILMKGDVFWRSPISGQAYSTSQYAATNFTIFEKGGLVLDTEAWTKAETGLLKKGLSYLGFSSDIFLQKFNVKNPMEKEDKELEVMVEHAFIKNSWDMDFKPLSSDAVLNYFQSLPHQGVALSPSQTRLVNKLLSKLNSERESVVKLVALLFPNNTTGMNLTQVYALVKWLDANSSFDWALSQKAVYDYSEWLTSGKLA